MMRDRILYPSIHFWRVMRGFATLIKYFHGRRKRKKEDIVLPYSFFNNPLSALTDYFFIIDEYKLDAFKIKKKIEAFTHE